MLQKIETFSVRTTGQGLVDITPQIRTIVLSSHIKKGLVTVYCRHTSASLLIQENADPDVQTDLLSFFQRLVPEDDPLFVHRTEGPDDMPAHIKSALTQTSLSIPLLEGNMSLGTWQGIYLFEHRSSPHTRNIVVHAIGES